VPDAIDELLATHVALHKLGAHSRDDPEQTPTQPAASSPSACMVVVRRVDRRAVSRDVDDEPPIVKAIGRCDHIDPKLCRR
jgi:hypothetical protein